MIIEIEKGYENTITELCEIVRDKRCRPEVYHGDLFNLIAIEGDASTGTQVF